MSDSSRLIVVSEDLSIVASEIEFSYSPSGGPGGQHANRSATRVTLRFDIAGSPSLTDDQRRLLLSRLGSRLDASGVLQISSDQTRSQRRNREQAVERLRDLLAEALVVAPPRRRTRPHMGSIRRRLDRKRRRGAVKRDRRRKYGDDD